MALAQTAVVVRVLCVLGLAGLLAVAAGPAFAQPSSLTISAPVADATGATFTVTWPGGSSFAWSGGYSDGTAFQQGTSASPLMLRMPYHASGAAMPGWVCASTSCGGFTVPAKPTTPPATSQRTIEYTEPTLNAPCPSVGSACGTPLNDLGTMRLYYSLNGAAEIMVPFAASSPAGGVFKVQPFTVAAVSGTITYAVTAVDTAGNESARAIGAPFIFGGVVPGAIPGTPTFTLRP